MCLAEEEPAVSEQRERGFFYVIMDSCCLMGSCLKEEARNGDEICRKNSFSLLL